MLQPFAVTFAGVPGSSKTIIAQHLSLVFSLPILSTDVVRAEVKEDMLAADINKPAVLQEYKRRINERRRSAFADRQPLILDASVERHWPEDKAMLERAGYSWFLISLDLSESFLRRLFNATGRKGFAEEQLPVYFQQHADFTHRYSSDICVHITNELFPARRETAEMALRTYLETAKQ